MPSKRESTRNFNTEAIVDDKVQITVDTAVKVLDPVADLAESRLYVSITVLVRPVFIRLMPANVESTVRKGIYLEPGLTYEFLADNSYLGEVSIINTKNNDKPEYYLTRY